MVSGTKESGAHVAYLCDVGPLGLGELVGPGDPLRVEHNPTGAQLTSSSPEHDASLVSVPLREQ